MSLFRARTSIDRAANAQRVAELISLRGEDTRRLGQQEFRNAGKRYGIEAAALHAFTDVESSTGGFMSDGRLVPLYEPHIFSAETGGRFDRYEDVDINCAGVLVSYRKWVPPHGKLPPGCEFHPYNLDYLGRWGLIAFAAELDFEAALKATSWGAFQLLGRNHAELGYPTAWHFVCSLYDGERSHLDAAISYLISRDVLDAMRKGRWREVITAWNGPGQVDRYLSIFLKRLEERRKAYA